MTEATIRTELEEEPIETTATSQPEKPPETEEVSIESLQAQIEELNAQLKDEQLRNAANIQNLNRRHQDELQNAHKFSCATFAKEMLPIKDFIEMALKDQSGNFDALKMGVEMTLKQLVSAFNNVGLTEIDPSGQAFDPNLHQAMKKDTESDAEPNTVVSVMQKGYTIHGRVLRPALVVVAAEKE